MDKNKEILLRLFQKLESLAERQEAFSDEIHSLKEEIIRLQDAQIEQTPETIQEPTFKVQQDAKETEISKIITKRQELNEISEKQKSIKEKPTSMFKMDLEKFIGENLINKIGIAITIIGVAIGAKYSIEHDLISPLTRIILGYLAGTILLGVGIKLKGKYANYSAVLVSGAMAIMYFITFGGYSFYGLMPVTLAFLLMVVFTVFTVVASLSYDNQVIALIGLVGAYAVPFLLGSESGNVKVLFSYMVIINIGILVLSFKKYWKILYNASFILSWAIYLFWYNADFEVEANFGIALIFSILFFLTFYVTFLAYKLVKKEVFSKKDILFLLLNSFIFYGVGYSILVQHEIGKHLLGLFTVGNALIHFTVSVIVFRKRLSDKNLFYLISGLVLVFLTIAVPVQLDGRWVTLLWSCEAALIFWIGRTKGVSAYEVLSYPLILLAFLSLIQDWGDAYNGYIPKEQEYYMTPIFNINFLTSVLFILGIGFIYYLKEHKKFIAPKLPNFLTSIIAFSIPAILLLSTFFSIWFEIAHYWDQLYVFSSIEINDPDNNLVSEVQNYNLKDFKTIWIINYSMLFALVLTILNSKKLKKSLFGEMCLGFSGFMLSVFLILGLYTLSDLRESYLTQFQAEYFNIDTYNLIIRYISFAFAGALLYSTYVMVKQEFMNRDFRIAFDIALHIVIIWILSSELIQWLDISGSSQTYKLGLSILWGSYSLILIILGIWKKRKYLRIEAIVLFAATLGKLFLYDVSHLGTIAKTIVFVLLGILLLIISFLYNKYKHIIANEEQN